jgi:fibronectin type 3 domain-containing protein
VASNAVATVDVTAGVTLNGPAGFRIASTTGDGVHYWSSEAATAGNRPQLTVTCATSSPSPDSTAPTAPSNLAATSASPTTGVVSLQWAPSTDNATPTGYQILRNGAQVGTVTADALSYDDTAVGAGQQYAYTVRAVDDAGNTSAPSNTVAASP